MYIYFSQKRVKKIYISRENPSCKSPKPVYKKEKKFDFQFTLTNVC